jgi:hypothetical protein
MIAKITDLKTTNRRLEETNMQLVSSNDKLASELQTEKGKKEVLVKRLKKMASMFDKQQQSVQTIIQQNSQRLESEVNNDVNDALYAATDSEGNQLAAPTQTYTAPVRTPTMTSAPAEEEDALKLPPGLDDDEDEAPVPHVQHAAPVRPAVQSQPKAAPHGGEMKKAVSAAASAAAAHAKQAVAEAAAKAKAAADAKVQAEMASKPKPAPKAAAPVAPPVPKAAPKPASSADDEQLKALRSEVESLEDSVKNDDEAPSASAASMLHVHKRTTKVATEKKSDEGSDSVKTLQDVGGMLSAAMAAGDDDN